MTDSFPSTYEHHLRNVEVLYSEHQGWLYAFLQKKIGNTMDAADLMQDTFIRILAAKSLPIIEEPRAYLSCIAKGILVNWYQRKALERAYLAALAELPEEHVPCAESSLIILETLHEIDAMLNALPPLVKRTFLLSQIAGMKYADIAQEIGVSLITVKRYMKQAFIQCLAVME
ncbi:sigma-70 family RNA polymerase sigma factor [Pseudomonas sp. M30-35]|uniref:sigma-70 family RNA polymerase sigma factor n=1 Tax=Pseudomonas sp. M30-35 TaxID=1981174 RepID=UPI000B3C81C6|nr:sigma-70 family RNA polymerase sigma factor [Pseudomonas sp. M30-35]ARU88949.1 RNA polymerase subunit sigma [Pseudomonas sp. M30-35]